MTISKFENTVEYTDHQDYIPEEYHSLPSASTYDHTIAYKIVSNFKSVCRGHRGIEIDGYSTQYRLDWLTKSKLNTLNVSTSNHKQTFSLS